MEERTAAIHATAAVAVVSILVVDDHPVVRHGLAQALTAPAGHPGFAVVGTAGSGEEALAVARRRRPDVAVVDLRLDGEDGLEVAADLREAVPGLAVVAFTSFANARVARLCRRDGVAGFVVKGSPLTTLVEAVGAVAEGDAYVDPRFGGDPPPAPESPVGRPTLVRALTQRERDVLALVRWGHSNREIARELGVSLPTVKTHVQHILQKLGAADRRHAVHIAIAERLS